MTVHDCPHCSGPLPRAWFSSAGVGHNSRPRSIDQHKRFFGIIKALFAHWPETHQLQFKDALGLRKWLTMKAGWRDIAAHAPLANVRPEAAVHIADMSMRAAGAHGVAVAHDGDLYIFVPKSIRFDRMEHMDFCALNDAVAKVIRDETGFEPEQLLKEMEQAA